MLKLGLFRTKTRLDTGSLENVCFLNADRSGLRRAASSFVEK